VEATATKYRSSLHDVVLEMKQEADLLKIVK
jgi:hypothetical protein